MANIHIDFTARDKKPELLASVQPTQRGLDRADEIRTATKVKK